MPVVDVSKCKGCGLCVEACKCGAIVMKKGKAVVIETDACGWCLKCENICPTGAIVCPYEIVIEEG
jgi:NAD-dependent dihydropyrimidine dehydrogenase PreA subunit